MARMKCGTHVLPAAVVFTLSVYLSVRAPPLVMVFAEGGNSMLPRTGRISPANWNARQHTGYAVDVLTSMWFSI